MDKKDITKIVNNQLCFSCGACEVVCPVDCIDFNIKNSGRLSPQIDYKKCIECSKCYNICPSIDEKHQINKKFNFLGETVNAYFGKTKNERIYSNSQSGGMVTEVLNYLFDKGLIKYAVVATMDYSVFPKPRGILISSKEELFKYQKSIYLPINILEVFKNIDEINGDIAIVGISCQMEGLISLRAYKPKIFNKIKYKLGLICDRTLSYLSNIFFKADTEYKIIYRDKLNPNYLNANITIEAKDTKKITIDRSIRFWLKEYITPSRCYICFDKMNIHSDFVFGDPWGIDGYNKEKGESILITRNKIAEDIIQNIINENKAELKKIDYRDILKGQQIEKRKEKVLNSLAVYKKYNKKIPEYYSSLILPNNIDKKIEQKILYFWKMEEKNFEKNVKELKIKLFIFQIKNKIKKAIKGFIK